MKKKKKKVKKFLLYTILCWSNLAQFCGTTTKFGFNLKRCLFAIIAVGQVNKFSCFFATLIFRLPEQPQTNSMFNGFSFLLIVPSPVPFHPSLSIYPCFRYFLFRICICYFFCVQTFYKVYNNLLVMCQCFSFDSSLFKPRINIFTKLLFVCKKYRVELL